MILTNVHKVAAVWMPFDHSKEYSCPLQYSVLSVGLGKYASAAPPCLPLLGNCSY